MNLGLEKPTAQVTASSGGISMTRFVYHPLWPLVMFTVALSVVFSAYLVAGMAPSEPVEIVASFYVVFLLVYWIVADARRYERIPCFDFGFLCYVFFPFTLVWYCFWSRGWRGALTLLVLITIFFAPYIVAMIVWTALYGTA